MSSCENDIGASGGPVTSRAGTPLATCGRVDGLTCHSNTPLGPTERVVLRTSSNRIGCPPFSGRGDVAVRNYFVSSSLVPGFAVPVITECLAGSAAFSSAMKYASRLPFPAYGPLPKYSAGTPAG